MILQGVNGYANAPQYSVIRTLPVVLKKNLYAAFVHFFIRESCSPSSPLKLLFIKLLRVDILRPKFVVSEIIL
jgi:hypothetical protein